MRVSAILPVLLLILLPLCANAAEERLKMEIGARGGADVSKRNLEESYETAEIYLLKQLPWSATLAEQATLTSRFNLAATYLETGGDEGAMMSAGVDLVLGLWGGGVEIEAGFRPTWMFDHNYGDDDFGGGMQFTSHAGLAVNWHQAVINYRIQHTSNAGIYKRNPGLNLHMVGLGYRF